MAFAREVGIQWNFLQGLKCWSELFVVFHSFFFFFFSLLLPGWSEVASHYFFHSTSTQLITCALPWHSALGLALLKLPNQVDPISPHLISGLSWTQCPSNVGPLPRNQSHTQQTLHSHEWAVRPVTQGASPTYHHTYSSCTQSLQTDRLGTRPTHQSSHRNLRSTTVGKHTRDTPESQVMRGDGATGPTGHLLLLDIVLRPAYVAGIPSTQKQKQRGKMREKRDIFPHFLPQKKS